MLLFGRKDKDSDRWIFSTVKGTLDTHIIDADPRMIPRCLQHWPIHAGKLDEGGVFYDNKCGTCGETIFPHSWVTVDR